MDIWYKGMLIQQQMIKVTEENGSWRYLFEGNNEVEKLVVYKGSICTMVKLNSN